MRRRFGILAFLFLPSFPPFSFLVSLPLSHTHALSHTHSLSPFEHNPRCVVIFQLTFPCLVVSFFFLFSNDLIPFFFRIAHTHTQTGTITGALPFFPTYTTYNISFYRK